MHIRLIFLNLLLGKHDDGDSWLAGTDGIVPLSGSRKADASQRRDFQEKL